MMRIDDPIQVCIVTFNNSRSIASCLSALIASRESLSLRVALFDNGSSDDTVEQIRSGFPEIELTVSRRNLGFGAAHNRMLRDCETPHALLLNPDTVLRGDCVRRLVECLLEHPAAAIAAPRLEYPDGTPQPSFGPFPGWLADYRQRAIVRSVRRRTPRALSRLESRLSRPFEPDWVSGACVLVETAAFHDVCGFDEGFHLYLEDVDLCRRLRQRGRTARVDPRAVCVHEEGGSVIDDQSRLRAYRESRLRYETKHGSRLGAAIYRLLRITLPNVARRMLR